MTPEKGKYNYTPNQGFFGTDSIKFTVTHAECTNVSSIGTAYFVVDPPDSCIIPTIITPNNDNLNDGFQVRGQYIVKMKLVVFDRWGVALFVTEKNEPWDGSSNGKPMPSSTYIWKVDITDKAGRTYSQEGTVALIR